MMTMFGFEGIGIATAMPVVAQDLGGLSMYAWAFNGYLVSSLVAMVIAGEWCDRAGPRLPMTVGATVFGLGAFIAGAAWNMPVLIGGRVIEGIGGGLCIVAVYVILGRAFPDAIRPRAFTLLSMAWVAPSIVGPFVAGFLTDYVSWRLVFWLVVPFIIPVVLLAQRLVRLGGGADEAPPRWNRLMFAVAAATGLALLQEAGARRDALGIALAIVALAILIPALSRLLPHGALWFAPGLPTVVMMRGVLAGAFFAGEAFVPLALHTLRGASTAQAGLILTVGALAWALGSQTQGRLYGRMPRGRLVEIGATLTATCLLLLPLALVPWLPFWIAAVPWFIGALGTGMCFGVIGTLTLEMSDPGDQGTNSAAVQVLDSVGSVVCIGVAGAIFAGAHAADHVSAWTFVTMWWVMAAVALGGAIAARRIPAAASS